MESNIYQTNTQKPNDKPNTNKESLKDFFTKNPNAPLITTLIAELVLIVGLAIPVTINFLNPNSSPSQSSNSNTQSSEEQILAESDAGIQNKDALDTNDFYSSSDCDVAITKEEPFASIEMEYPVAGIYESKGRFICNAELSYVFSIPENISRVFFYVVGLSGQISIVGLEIDGEILSAPITQSNYTLAFAGALMFNLEQIKSTEGLSNYKLVLKYDRSNTINESDSMNDETTGHYGAYNGKSYTTDDKYYTVDYSIYFVGPFDYRLGLDYSDDDSISPEWSENLKYLRDNKNQRLIDEVEKAFGNPENYQWL